MVFLFFVLLFLKKDHQIWSSYRKFLLVTKDKSTYVSVCYLYTIFHKKITKIQSSQIFSICDFVSFESFI